mgnify:CR=1 FL=1
MKYYTIYKTTCQPTGKIYIGQHTTSKIDDRYIGSGKIIKNAIKKYGRHNFTKDILEVCDTLEIQNIREEYWIQLFDSRNPEIGYNIDTGGYLGPRSDLARKNISNANKSADKRNKISVTLMNHVVKDITRDKIRESILPTMTPERKQFQRNNMLGRKKMRCIETGKCSHIRADDIQHYINNGWILCVN